MAILCSVDEISKAYPEIIDMLKRHTIDLMAHEINIFVTCSGAINRALNPDKHISLFINGMLVDDDVFCEWIQGKYDKPEEVRSVEISMIAGEPLIVIVQKYTL